MCNIYASYRRALIHALVLLFSLHLLAGSANAQPGTPPACTQDCLGGNDTSPPGVSFSPGEGTYAQPSVPVEVTFTDAYTLDDGSLVITLNGKTVTPSFQYTRTTSAPLVRAVARGTIALRPGRVDTVTASIQDQSGNPGETTVLFAFGVPAVAVGPDGGTASVAAGSSPSQAFTVTNRGPASATFALHAACRRVDTGAAVAGCAIAPASPVTLAAGASTTVSVSYAPGAAGNRVSLRLRARQRDASGAEMPGVDDAGWVEADVYGAAGGVPQSLGVSLVDLNSGTTVSRDECVTVSAGAGAAYECGDLRLVHGIPGMMTLGRPRAPVLLYNSQHANVRPVVYADVTRPAGTPALSQVVATVTLADGTEYTRRFAGSDWQPGSTRRIGVQWDGLSNSWGLMPYALRVTATYAVGAQPPATLVNGEMMVTNRADSPLGQGWWLAGMEFIACFCQGTPTRMAHWSGDGSMRVYDAVTPGQMWVAQNPAGPPDTLVKVMGGYMRRLRGGGEIHFDDIGRHVRTVSRLRDTTHFVYDGNLGVKVTYVSIPRRDGQASGFRFTYTGGYVSAITPEIGTQSLPGISIGRSGGRITSITDPDNLTTRFGYGDPLNPNRVTSRTARDTTLVTYGYDGAGKLSTVTLALSDTASIVTGFTAAESRGVHPDTLVRASVAVSQAYTRIDGPRTDVADETRIWVTARGAPGRIRDALGNETVLRRAEPGFPALVTEVRGPDAMGDTLVVKSRATYDFRGRVDTATGVSPFGNGDLVTRYAYDDRWDAPDTVWSPGVAPTVMAYDTLYGNLVWQQQGGPLRRVYLDYDTAGQARGLLTRVRYPHPLTGPATPQSTDTIMDRMGYDGAGNLRWTRTPLGFLTHHYRDTRGRDSVVVTPVHRDSSDTEPKLLATGVRTRTSYDLMGRVRATEAVGRPVAQPGTPDGRVPPRIVAQETLRVETELDAMGRPRVVRRWSVPDTALVDTLVTRYGYDRAGRKTSERAPGAARDSIVYDRAGNAVMVITPLNYVITLEYDVLGRLTRRNVPAAGDPRECPPLYPNCTGMRFPFYATGPQGGFSAPAETFIYRHDALGHQVYAENLDAKVSRTFHPGGALRTDTIRMRTYAGMDYERHVFGLEYRYDAAGRLRALAHPATLAGSTAQADSFAYDSVTGALRYARSRQGQGLSNPALYGYGFEHDLLGQRTRTVYPGGGEERLTYDREGRRHTRVDEVPGAVLASDTLGYDARGKMTYVAGVARNQPTHFYNWYSGLGNLVGTDWLNDNNAARLTEVTVVDAMGNQVLRTRWPDGAATPPRDSTRYEPGTGRVARMFNVPPSPMSASFRRDTTYRQDDLAGNVTWGIQRQQGELSNGTIGVARHAITRNYYGADNTVRAVQVHDQSGNGSSTFTQNGSYAEYRYDPLGRRIMERTRRDSVCFNAGHGCESTLTRFVWAGDQLLWELRVPGGDSVPATSTGLESTSAAGDMYGRVSYFHAGSIDRPLLITKEGAESVAPRETWRGQFHAGTSPTTGAVRDCQVGGQTNCLLIAWPGWKTTASHAWGDTIAPDIDVWYGGLVDGMRDASGQMYMRNRYYDPATGQFTQTDPIGLAGGLNAYGFAAGDPVSYSDPYGLRVCGETQRERARIEETYKVDVTWDNDGCVSSGDAVRRLENSEAYRELQDAFTRLIGDERTWTVTFSRLSWHPRSWGGSRHFRSGRKHYTVYINPGDTHGDYWYESDRRCIAIGPWGVHALIAHELTGHGMDVVSGNGYNQENAIEWENKYNRIIGRPDRSYRCHP